MRTWCAVVAMGAFLALPVFAQQKDNSTSSNTNATAETAEKGGAEAAANVAPAAHSVLALPQAAKKKAAPAAAAPLTPGRMVPRYEISGGYSYIDFSPGSPFANFNNQGGGGGFTFNATRYLGLTAEVDSYHFSRGIDNGSGTSTSAGGRLTTYLFGPRLNLRRFDHFVPFAEFLFGGAYSGGDALTGNSSQSSAAMAAGGGIDVVITEHIAWRFAQIDYLMTNFSGDALGASSRQNNLRLGTGVVVRWGIPNPPPPPNHPPVAACSATPASVYQGSGDPVAVHVTASDPDNDTLTYAYTATGGAVEGTGADARWNSTGTAVGTYTVNAKVDDGKGGTATCSADIKVEERPHHPPTISCAPDRSPIMPGERATIKSTASSPDNQELTYNYSAAAGQVSGTGPTAQFDSTGLSAGSYKVNCGVTDSRGDKAEATTSVDVQQPPPPPQAVKVGDCGYNKAGASRFDNACKRVGDDVALRLTSDPTSKLVIVGIADPKEPKAAKLAETRAELAKKYIVEKGVDASRITTRAGSASTEKGMEKENRRVDFVIVPEGATY